MPQEHWQRQQTKHWYLPSKAALALLALVEHLLEEQAPPQLEEQVPRAYALAASSSNQTVVWVPDVAAWVPSAVPSVVPSAVPSAVQALWP